MSTNIASRGRTVRDIADERHLRDAIDLFSKHLLHGCVGADSVRTESTLVLYEDGVPVAAGEVRWNSFGVVGLNRMALSDVTRLPAAELAMLDHAMARRPPWVPEPVASTLGLAA